MMLLALVMLFVYVSIFGFTGHPLVSWIGGYGLGAVTMLIFAVVTMKRETH